MIKNGATRRGFLKGSAALAAVAGMGLIPRLSEGAVKSPLIDVEAKKFRSSCTVECLHHNLTAYVINGKIRKVETSACSDTKACARGLSRTQYVYSPNRVLYPLLRTGEKGSGQFKRISWNEAFTILEEQIRKTIKEYGNSGLFYSAYTGNMDALSGSFGDAFFRHLGGYTTRSGSVCCGAISGIMPPMVGLRYVDTRDTIENSKYIINWGNNPAVTLQAYYKRIRMAQDNGAKMITIDPRFSETASKSDEWIPIIPGTDGALALGMLRVIIKEKLYDTDFLTKHSSAVFLVDDGGNLVGATDGKYKVWCSRQKKAVDYTDTNAVPTLSAAGIKNAGRTVYDLIAAECEQWTPKKVEEETSIPAKTVERIAREYASVKPAMLIQNMGGFQRTEYSGYTAMAHIYLAVFTGSYGVAGGGILDAGGATQFARFSPPIKSPDVNIPKMPISQIGKYILEDKPNKIGFMWLITFNPVAQLPNANEVIRAFKKVPFVVVTDNIMTDSCRYADLVLPATTIFEFESVLAGIRNHYVMLMEKAVEPQGEARPDTWIFTELAKRMGFGEPFDKPIRAHIETVLAPSGITYEQIKEGPVKPVETPSIPFKDGQFRTPTGKAHLFVQDFKDKLNESPIAVYRRAVESPKGSPELFKKYPLMAVQKKTQRTVHSSFSTLQWLLEANGSIPTVTVNSADALTRGIKHGDKIKVYNDRGEHYAIAEVNEHVMKGVIVLENGWSEKDGGSTNVVTNDKPEPLGHGASYNNTLVEIMREV